MRGIPSKSERIGLLTQVLHFWDAYSSVKLLMNENIIDWEQLSFVRNSVA